MTIAVQSSQELLDEVILRIREVSNPEQIILFGSSARGNSQPDSDFDILVVKGEVESTRKETSDIYWALADIPLPVDIVVVRKKYLEKYKNIIGTVIRPAVREGVILYARWPRNRRTRSQNIQLGGNKNLKINSNG